MNKGTAIVGFFLCFLAGMGLMWGISHRGEEIAMEGDVGPIDHTTAKIPVDPATDPTAQALKYHQNSAEADRAGAARPGLPPEEQHCANCQFVLADTGEWRPCSLFPGKAVNQNGWCASWTLKAG